MSAMNELMYTKIDRKDGMSSVAKQSLVDTAYDRLKQEILLNRLPAGFQATEPELALRLGISRTPVREALIKLEANGLVELIPRRGARVLPLSIDDMREIYEILTALEPDAAAHLASTKPSRKQIAPLEKACTDMEDALARDSLDDWAEADDRFHKTLLDLHGNRRLTDFVNSLIDQAHRARVLTLRLRDKPTRSTEDHREIIMHILDGDADKAREAFRAHRQRAATELLGILQNYRLPQL